MDSLNKTWWAILGVPLLGILAFMAWGNQSDRARFDELRIGMTAKEVQAIVAPKTGKHRHLQRDFGANEVLHLNDRMILTIRDGILVDKEWTGKEEE